MSTSVVPLIWQRIILVALTVMGCGCRHVSPPREPEGKASFRFIEPPAPPPASRKATLELVQSGPIFVPAEPRLPLAIPIYPKVALRARGFGTTVSVHVSIDAKGRVAEVRPSLFGFTMPSPFAQEFFEAVEQAVFRWTFTPAEIRYPEAVTLDGADHFRSVVRSEAVDTEFDVSFFFTSTGAVVVPGR